MSPRPAGRVGKGRLFVPVRGSPMGTQDLSPSRFLSAGAWPPSAFAQPCLLGRPSCRAAGDHWAPREDREGSLLWKGWEKGTARCLCFSSCFLLLACLPLRSPPSTSLSSFPSENFVNGEEGSRKSAGFCSFGGSEGRSLCVDLLEKVWFKVSPRGILGLCRCDGDS